MSALSYSKLIMVASNALTASLSRPRAASESASRWRRSRSASACARAMLSRRACSRASESARARARRAFSIESALAAGAGGGAACLPPQAAAAITTATPKVKGRVSRMVAPECWVLGTRDPGGPRRQTGLAQPGHLTHSSGVEVDDPQLARSRAVGHEGHVPAIRRPRGIFVAPGAGQLAHAARRYVHHKNLRATGDITMEREIEAVRRPFWCVRAAGDPVVEGREQLLSGAVRCHDVNLSRSGAGRNECDPARVRTVCRGQVI